MTEIQLTELDVGGFWIPKLSALLFLWLSKIGQYFPPWCPAILTYKIQISLLLTK